MDSSQYITPTERYKILALIGQGAYANVYHAYDEIEEKDIAIKMINLQDCDDDIDLINAEINTMISLDLPQLIKYYSSYIVGSYLWIVMELAEGGSLADVIKYSGPLDEDSISFILYNLLLALNYLHKQNKIHRDVKAGNLLVNIYGDVKLADFGVTTELTETMDKKASKIGTPFWMAPEVIVEAHYDGCADIWSTGITAIELALGSPPYSDMIHPHQVIYLIPSSPPPRLEGYQFSADFKDFIAKCLVKEAKTRATAEELLQHIFFKKYHVYNLITTITETDDINIVPLTAATGATGMSGASGVSLSLSPPTSRPTSVKLLTAASGIRSSSSGSSNNNHNNNNGNSIGIGILTQPSFDPYDSRLSAVSPLVPAGRNSSSNHAHSSSSGSGSGAMSTNMLLKPASWMECVKNKILHSKVSHV